DILQRAEFLLHLLVIPSSLDQRFQHTTNNPNSPCAHVVPQLGDREAICGTAGAVESLPGDVVLHHDARIQRGKVELVEPLVNADKRDSSASPAKSLSRIAKCPRSR